MPVKPPTFHFPFLAPGVTILLSSYKWNNAIFVLLSLAYFSLHSVFGVHVCCSPGQNSSLGRQVYKNTCLTSRFQFFWVFTQKMFLELELLGLVISFGHSEEWLRCFPQWLHHFVFPPAMPKHSNFFLTHTNTCSFSLSFIMTKLMVVKWQFIGVLIGIFLTISDVELGFMGLVPFADIICGNV